MINISSPEIRQIPGFSKYYIDINGNVYSVNNPKKLPKIVKGRIPKGKKNLVIWMFNDNNVRKLKNINTIMCLVWIGKPKKNQIVIHKDNNPYNLFIGNLLWGYTNDKYIAMDGYKICRKCEIRKPITEYGPRDKSSDGLKNYCYDCRRKEYRSINGLIRNMLINQKQSSIRRKHNEPSYTYKELYDWVVGQHNFISLYKAWVESNYLKRLIPSIDRIDNKKGYTFDNIRLMTWEENDILGRESRNKRYGCYEDDRLIKVYHSLKDIKKELNVNKSNIIRAVKTNKKAYGYYWKHL